jgi:hypothetical protein
MSTIGRRIKVNMGSGEKTAFVFKKLKEYSDKNLKKKFWYEICELKFPSRSHYCRFCDRKKWTMQM